MTKKERLQNKLTDKKQRLQLYKEMEIKMMTGAAQAYSLGSRSKTNYSVQLNEIRTAIASLESEIEELEGLLSGEKSRKIVQVIPRF
ncbi:MAG: hypothetical protein IKW45_03835 [Clostridia bacterium]|nr:hypothetical protein [Clostridia bacterium]